MDIMERTNLLIEASNEYLPENTIFSVNNNYIDTKKGVITLEGNDVIITGGCIYNVLCTLKMGTETGRLYVPISNEGEDTRGFGGHIHQFPCCGEVDYIQSNNSHTGAICFNCSSID